MAIINTRSPHYVGLANVNIAYATLDIEVYSGNKNNGYSGNPQYSLRKQLIAGDAKIFFEVSELIRDYLDIKFSGFYFDSDQLHTCKWVRMITTAFDSNGGQLTQATSIDLVIDGYSYFEEGNFYSYTGKNILMSNREVFALDDNIYRIPLYIGEEVSVAFLRDGEIVGTYTNAGGSLLNSEQVAHISINGISAYDSFTSRIVKLNGEFENNKCISQYLNTLSIGKVDTIHIGNTDGTLDIINVKTIDECRYEPKKITFVNKFGVLQDMYFFKKMVEKMTTKRESYKSNILNLQQSNDYNIYEHTKRDFNISANESMTLSSGFLSESYNEVFKQLMLSEKVWITNRTDTSEKVLPINIKTSDITYKTSLNDKLVEYTIEFDNSYNVLNDIR
jgi:hypothetical protein